MSTSKKSEEAEQLLNIITNQQFLGILVFKDNLIHFVNETTAEILEYPFHEIKNWSKENFFNIVYLKDRPLLIDYLDILRKENLRRPNFSFRISTNHGKLKWIGLYSKNVKIEEENYNLVFLHDVTENEFRFQTLFEAALNPIFIVDKNGIFIDVNRAGLKFLECNKAELIKKQVWDFVPPGQLELQRKEHFKFLGRRTVETDYYVNNKIKTLLLNVVPVTIFGKTIYYGIGQDITERKITEKLLRESEQKYSVLVEQAKDGVIIVQDGVFKFSNKTLSSMIGYEINEIIGAPITKFIAPEYRELVTKRYRLRMSGEKVPPRYEIKILCKDGTIKDVELTATIILFKGRPADMGILRDITARKSMEEKIKKSEELFKKIFEVQKDAIFILNSSIPPTIINCNPAASRIFGYSTDEMRGKTIDFLHIDTDTFRYFQSLLYTEIEKEGFFYLSEYKMKRKDGSLFYSEHSVIPLIDPEGKRTGWVSVIRDTTNLRNAIINLKSERDRLNALMEALYKTGISIDIVNSDFEILYQNPTLIEKFGVFKGKKCYEHYLGLKNHCPQCPMIKSIKEKKVITENLIGKDKRHYQIFSSPLSNPDGSVSKVINVIIDITDLKNAEMKIKKSEEKYRLISENANDLIAILKEDFRHEYINKEAYQKILGYTDKEIIGKSPIDFIHSEDSNKALKMFKKIFVNNAASGEFKIRKKDGAYIWLETKGKLFLDKDGTRKALLISREISKRKELEKAKNEYLKALEDEIEEKTKQLVQKEKLASIGMLAAGVAHEINNPIMGIINYAEIIKDELNSKLELDINKKPYSFINGIIKEGERIAKIVKDLLTFARKDTKDFVNEDICNVINSSISLISSKLKADRIEIIRDFKQNIPKIKMKPQKIQQVILNILQNSMDALNRKFGSYPKEESKQIHIKTSITKKNKKKHLKIEIRDNGEGIKKENLLRIFDPFYTTKSHSEEHGTGLGLNISYNIIKSHNGEIIINSEWKRYTTVQIYLPLK